MTEKRKNPEPTVWYELQVLNPNGTIAYYINSDSWSQYYSRRNKWDEEWKALYEANPDAPCITDLIDWNVYGFEQVLEHRNEILEKDPDTWVVIVQTTKIVIPVP